MLDGIICINKPPEHTSHDVVARMRGIAKTRKIGHGGTLDPMATGVLPVFIGRAAKAVELIPNQDKRYTATFKLGIQTDTQDITGTVISTCDVNSTAADVEAMLAQFTGTQLQTPPMYSAVQVDGKRLYDLARQGIEVERPQREITIYSLNLLEVDEATHTYKVAASCSKGTYIRTLCHDIGQELGCGATLTALVRTEAMGYRLEQCISIEEAGLLAADNRLDSAVLPVESVFASLPRLELSEKLARHFCNGVALSLNQFPVSINSRTAVFRDDGVFLGIGEPRHDEELKIDRLYLTKLFYL